MKNFILRVFVAAFLLFSSNRLCAETAGPSSLESVELLTGFGWGKLRATDNYNLYPIIVSFDFSLKPFLKKFNIRPRQLAQFQVEPFISAVSSPNTNVESGASFFFKLGLLPQSSRFQPYAKVGAGIVYMSQHTREQATQYNFIEQAGAGLHYFFSKNTAFTLEGRLRHLSNAGIEHPNQGINTYFVVTGLTYQF